MEEPSAMKLTIQALITLSFLATVICEHVSDLRQNHINNTITAFTHKECGISPCVVPNLSLI